MVKQEQKQRSCSRPLRASGEDSGKLDASANVAILATCRYEK